MLTFFANAAVFISPLKPPIPHHNLHRPLPVILVDRRIIDHVHSFFIPHFLQKQVPIGKDCDGYASALSTVFGCPPVTSFSQNVGLVAMTKVVNRFTIMTGAACMILAGLLPPVGNFFASLPQAVLGGCTIMMFGTILTSGVQMIAKCGFSQRNIVIVSLSLAVGIGFTTASEIGIWNIFPELVQSVFSANVVAVVFVVSVFLSLVLPKDAPKLQDTFAAVQNSKFIDGSQLMPGFLVVHAVGLLAMEDDKFQNIASLHKLYRDYIHDIHLYLRQIRVFASNKQHKKIIEIVDKLEGEIQMGGHNIIYNTNEVLNTILAEYVLEAQNKGIELSVFVEDCLNVDFISDADMISMFGNLLNNALEATAKCEAGHRKADVKLFMGNQYMLVLYIKNSFLVSVQWEGEELLTTKKEKQFHGMGIGIVKRLAEKYGGTLMLEEKGSNFITTLIISACKK